jgi:hypothetical protein
MEANLFLFYGSPSVTAPVILSPLESCSTNYRMDRQAILIEAPMLQLALQFRPSPRISATVTACIFSEVVIEHI